MKRRLGTLACGLLSVLLITAVARADDLRNIKRGEQVPDFRMPTLAGQVIDSTALREKVVVLVYLSAEQKSSELAAAESQQVALKYADQPIQFLHATADVVHRAYFEDLRKQKNITLPLGLDPARELYSKLGLIVFPTTIVMDKQGKLVHVISTRGPDYAHVLDCYVRHALGIIDDAGLKEALTERTADPSSAQSLASRHRAAARLLRDKGLYDSAEEELKAALGYEPNNRDVQLDMADLYLRMNRAPEAEKLVNAVLEQDSMHHRARLLKGIALFRAGKLDESEKILLEVLVLNPDPARTHYYLGMLYEKKGQTAKALEHYREALSRVLSEPGLDMQPKPAPDQPTVPTPASRP